MPRNIQFQKGLSLTEFQKHYGTEEKCRAALLRDRWPRGFVCPRCGSSGGHALHTRSVVQCGGCRKQTSLTANTLFHSTKLPLTTWFLALYFITQTKTGMSTLELSRLLGVQQNTAWLILHKIMSAMADREAPRVLEHSVELDDAYIGGRLYDHRVGRGSPNKVPFLMAVEKTPEGHPHRVVVSVVDSFQRAEIANWMKTHVAPGSRIVSDGLYCFRAASGLGFDHRPIVVKGDRATMDTAFYWSSTILANLKTSLLGVYHKAKHKYLPRFFALFQYRFNRRMNLNWLITGTFRLAARSFQRPLWVLRLG